MRASKLTGQRLSQQPLKNNRHAGSLKAILPRGGNGSLKWPVRGRAGTGAAGGGACPKTAANSPRAPDATRPAPRTILETRRHRHATTAGAVRSGDGFLETCGCAGNNGAARKVSSPTRGSRLAETRGLIWV